jgi:phosphopentomutase
VLKSSSPFRRVILIVIDSLGIGELPDADLYGDRGSNTLGNISRQVSLRLPTLTRLGLGRAGAMAGVAPEPSPDAAFGRMREQSPGKDSVTGHWELAGLVLERAFPVFPEGFPPEIVADFERRIGMRVLGNKAASGTAIIEELGAAHLETGRPIVYTSADSVFQIAAHEDLVPPGDLYAMCRIAYDLVVEGHGVGRVIARPFVGVPGDFHRTANRKDFALPPRGRTLLDDLREADYPVVAIGKVEDLFAGRGISRAHHTSTDDEGMDLVETEMNQVREGLIFANLVDSDTVYGHRNDVRGYAANLERIDARIGELVPALAPADLLLVTGDHGNDPTTPSTDHSREYVPILATGPRVARNRDLGTRATFADLGQTVAEVFGVGPLGFGTSFLADLIAS